MNDFKLVELNQNAERHITVIEDLLDVNIFYDACNFVVKDFNDSNLIQNMAYLSVSPDAIYTGFSNELSGFEDNVLDSGRKRRKELMVFFSKHEIKYQLAKKYVEIFNTKKPKSPQWITDIVNLFSDKPTTKSKQSEERSDSH